MDDRGTLTCGILSIVFSVVSFFIFWWLAIVGLVLGIISLCLGSDSKKLLGIIGTALSAISLVLLIILVLL